MAPRLIEMRRILRPDGSIYLHCDDAADSYRRMLMDAVFGRGTFQNAITWKRTSAHNSANRFGRVSDRNLFYAGPGATWNPQYVEHDPEYIEHFYPLQGRPRTAPARRPDRRR